MKPKPQSNYKSGSIRDDCQTPPEAVGLLIPWLRRAGIEIVWEPATGDGLLANTLRSHGLTVIESDIKTNDDFIMSLMPLAKVDAIITNPPFSMAAEFARRCRETRLPWGLLMKNDVASSEKFRQAVWYKSWFKGISYPTYQVIVPSRRICFKMPNKGWFTERKNVFGEVIGIKNNGAQFHTNWYTNGLNLPHHTIRMEYQQVDRYKLGRNLKADFMITDKLIWLVPGEGCIYSEKELNHIIDQGKVDNSKIL